jgi:glycosyltransferase involved in cell wall biosynthesis
MTELIVTVGIPTRDRLELLEDTVASIYLQGIQSDLIIVDDASRVPISNSLKIAARVLRNTHPLGESASVNIIYTKCTTKYLTIVSDDDPQPTSWLKNLIDFAEANPDFLVYVPQTSIIKTNSEKILLPSLPYSKFRLFVLLQMHMFAGCLLNVEKLRNLNVSTLRSDIVYPNDFLQWLELCKLGDFVFVPQAESYWWERDYQISKSLSPKVKRDLYLKHVGSYVIDNSVMFQLIRESITALRASRLLLDDDSLNIFHLIKDVCNSVFRARHVFNRRISLWFCACIVSMTILFIEKITRPLFEINHGH